MVVEGLGRNHGTQLTMDESGVLHVGGGRFEKAPAPESSR